MNPVLEIKLLGGFQLQLDRQPLVLPHSSRLQSLLGYLSLYHESVHSRYNLATLLWPESTEGQAFNNLRSLLLRLRAAFLPAGSILVIEHDQLGWNPNLTIKADTTEFLTELKATNSEVELTHLIRASELYGGELLPDCLDEWVFPEREKFNRAYSKVVRQLVFHFERAGDFSNAVMYAIKLVEQNPLDEEACRIIMRLMAATGKRAMALQYYHTCKKLLKQELNLEPEPETNLLYHQLLDTGQLNFSFPATNPSKLLELKRQEMVIELEAELQKLNQALNSADSSALNAALETVFKLLSTRHLL